MKKLLVLLGTLLMLGCASKQVKPTVPSDFLSCDMHKDSELVCFSETECNKHMSNVGLMLATLMRLDQNNEASVDFRLVEVFHRRVIVGTVYTEMRGKSLWMIMDAIACDDDGNFIEEKHSEREFIIR